MAHRRAFPILALAMACLVQAPAPAAFAADDQLTAIREKVRQSFPTVQQLSPDDFLALQKDTQARLLILDVREPDEYAVSHLAGARRVDPKVTAEDFQKAFGPDLKGTTLVLYCSVGMRSSNLAARIAATAQQSGAASVYNLDGGLFRWHNEKRPLVKGEKATDEVHGYSFVWRRHLQRQDHVTIN